MIKRAWLWAACLAASPLLSETIGDVEFQFPPSNYEWRLLIDNDCFGNLFVDDEDFDEDESYEDVFEGDEGEETDLEALIPKMQFYTHREGDALELFVAMQVSIGEDEEDEDDATTLMQAQKEIDKFVNRFLPNHQFVLIKLEEKETEGFMEWVFSDGLQDLMHGYTRGFAKTADGKKTFTALGYSTTAIRTEHNRMLWTQLLNQAK
jgi:hypothetical protein